VKSEKACPPQRLINEINIFDFLLLNFELIKSHEKI